MQGQWAWVVANRPKNPEDAIPTRGPAPTSYADALTAFDEASAGLVAALRDADPADPAWTWSKEQTVGFILRRQAHEALIHRLDAELTAIGTIGELDPALASDGVEEVLDVMFGGLPGVGRVLAAAPLHPRRAHRHRRGRVGAAGPVQRHRPRATTPTTTRTTSTWWPTRRRARRGDQRARPA